MATPSASVDIWSVGCIMAELLQGKALFPGSDCILGSGWGGRLGLPLQGGGSRDVGSGAFWPVLPPLPHTMPLWAHCPQRQESRVWAVTQGLGSGIPGESIPGHWTFPELGRHRSAEAYHGGGGHTQP